MLCRRYQTLTIVLVLLSGCGQPVPDNPAPDRLVYMSLRPIGWQVYHRPDADTPLRPLTEGPALSYDPVISADGRFVVFTSERRGSPDLYALDLEEGGPPRLLIESDAMEDQATLSRDGAFLAFVSTASGNADVYVVPFRPDRTEKLSAARQITSDPGADLRPAFSPDGRWIAFSSDRDTPAVSVPRRPFVRMRQAEIYVTAVDGPGKVRRLTRSPGWDGSPAWSPDGAAIYFYSARGDALPGPAAGARAERPEAGRQASPEQRRGLPPNPREAPYRIWAATPDGDSLWQVSPPGMPALSPTPRPDGRLGFVSWTQVVDGDRDFRIVSVDRGGSDLRVESDTTLVLHAPHFSAGGAMVAHGAPPFDPAQINGVREERRPPWLVEPEIDLEVGSRQVRLRGVRSAFAMPPHPSRDLVVRAPRRDDTVRLVTSRLDGTKEREIFRHAPWTFRAGNVMGRKWSPDGEWITFTMGDFYGGPGGDADLWKVRADGSEVVRLTDHPANDGLGVFTPDGEALVFRSGRAGSQDLYLMAADGSNVRRLTEHPGTETFPAVSPDGDRVVFASDRDGERDPRTGYRTMELYTLELGSDGSPGEVRRVTRSAGHDAHPAFSPDGEWVVFTSERAGLNDEEPLIQLATFGPQIYGEIYAVRLEDGRTVRITHDKWEDGAPFWVGPTE